MSAEKKKGFFGEHPNSEDFKTAISGEGEPARFAASNLKDQDETFTIGMIFGLVGLVVVPFALAYGDHTIPGDPNSWSLLLLHYLACAVVALAYWQRRKRFQRHIEAAPVGEPLNHEILGYLERRYRIRHWTRQTVLSLFVVFFLLVIAWSLFYRLWGEGLGGWEGLKDRGSDLAIFVVYLWILWSMVQALRKNPYPFLLRALRRFRGLDEKECAATLAKLSFHLQSNRVLDTAWERLQEPAFGQED